MKFGVRVRDVHEANTSSAGFNSVFSFPNLNAYQAALQALAGGATQTSGPSQFTLDATTSGFVPTVAVNLVDAGLYVQDDWKVRPNLTLSGGLRWETQNAIHDHDDWAPRLGVSWGIGGGGKSAPKTVLRAGFGMFYTRFAQNYVLNADRLNGITQQQYALSTPCPNSPCPPINFFPIVPSPSQLPTQTDSSIYQIAPDLHATYIMQGAVSLERQLTKISSVTLTYLTSRGVHDYLSIDVNAPTPGTPNSSGPRPTRTLATSTSTPPTACFARTSSWSISTFAPAPSCRCLATTPSAMPKPTPAALPPFPPTNTTCARTTAGPPTTSAIVCLPVGRCRCRAASA